MLKNRALNLFATAALVGLAACAEEPADDLDLAEPATEEAAVIEPQTDPAMEVAPTFDPALDENQNGLLDPNEGMGDADGDGILDRDEEYIP